MIGRGAQGRPWFPGQVARFLATGERRPAPSLAAQHAMTAAPLRRDARPPRLQDRPPACAQASRLGARHRRGQRRRAGRGAERSSFARAHRRGAARGAAACWPTPTMPSPGGPPHEPGASRQRNAQLAGRCGAQCAAASGDHGVARRHASPTPMWRPNSSSRRRSRCCAGTCCANWCRSARRSWR